VSWGDANVVFAQDWPAAVQSVLPVQSFGHDFALWQILPRLPKSQQSSPTPVLQSWSAVHALSHELAQTPLVAGGEPPSWTAGAGRQARPAASHKRTKGRAIRAIGIVWSPEEMEFPAQRRAS
jgi:hypothetical protein